MGVWRAVWPATPIGGIVVFDDDGFDNCSGIAELVDGSIGLTDRIIVHNLNRHVLMVTLGGDPPTGQTGAQEIRPD
jgi:hypothetical protein